MLYKVLKRANNSFLLSETNEMQQKSRSTLVHYLHISFILFKNHNSIDVFEECITIANYRVQYQEVLSFFPFRQGFVVCRVSFSICKSLSGLKTDYFRGTSRRFSIIHCDKM